MNNKDTILGELLYEQYVDEKTIKKRMKIAFIFIVFTLAAMSFLGRDESLSKTIIPYILTIVIMAIIFHFNIKKALKNRIAFYEFGILLQNDDQIQKYINLSDYTDVYLDNRKSKIIFKEGMRKLVVHKNNFPKLFENIMVVNSLKFDKII